MIKKIRQIDYKSVRILVSFSQKCHVRLSGEESRYKFSGEMIGGENSEMVKIGDIRSDWQKSSFPVPWTDSPKIVYPE
tara:strand:- start:38 stop:271 length:234 start_codon:yes stop_codon:yes gene_type:complete